MVERGPWEADIPLDTLAATRVPEARRLRAAHHPAFDGICDVLEERATRRARRAPGYGHTVQRHPEFNDGSPTSSTARAAG